MKPTDYNACNGSSLTFDTYYDFKMYIDKFTTLSDEKKEEILNKYDLKYFNKYVVAMVLTDAEDYEVNYVNSVYIDNNNLVQIRKTVGTVFEKKEVLENEVNVYLLGFDRELVKPTNFRILFDEYTDTAILERAKKIWQNKAMWEALTFGLEIQER
jgi:hypothetical protein